MESEWVNETELKPFVKWFPRKIKNKISTTNKHTFYVLYSVHRQLPLDSFLPALHWMRMSLPCRGVWRSGPCHQTSLSSVSKSTGSWCSLSIAAALRATAAWPAMGHMSTSPVPPPHQTALDQAWRTRRSSTNLWVFKNSPQTPVCYYCT